MALIQNLSQLVDAAGRACAQTSQPAQARRSTAVMEEIGETLSVQQRLWHGQKLETLGRLAAGIAHDFGNLLTVVLGCSDLLESQLGQTDSRRDLVVEIHKAADQAKRLTRQILNFAGPQALEPQRLDLGSVLASTETMLRRLIADNILLSTVAPPDVWAVTMDRGQLQQIIVNLVVNARDAMPGGGHLTVSVANVPGDFVVLSVQDTGTGISPATLSRIFEPFFTTKGPGQGTGIGLSMVDDIVKQNGGHIDVETEIGKGSTFQIYLPRAQAMDPGEQERAPPARDDSEPLPRGNEVVLLVEDEEAVRNLIRQLLHMCGYQVLEAMNGREAIELAESHPGPIHLLLSDVVMPHVGGCQLADIIRARHTQLKVLFLSGHPVDYVYEQGPQVAEFAFLQKPFTVGTLARKLREVLDQK